jgi:hypothetical protein
VPGGAGEDADPVAGVQDGVRAGVNDLEQMLDNMDGYTI